MRVWTTDWKVRRAMMQRLGASDGGSSSSGSRSTQATLHSGSLRHRPCLPLCLVMLEGRPVQVVCLRGRQPARMQTSSQRPTPRTTHWETIPRALRQRLPSGVRWAWTTRKRRAGAAVLELGGPARPLLLLVLQGQGSLRLPQPQCPRP